MIETLHVKEQNKNQYNNLYQVISEQEIVNATKKLKRNKSACSDKIKNEMIKCSIHILIQGYMKLFNLILQTGVFPAVWCEGLITPIFKSDDKLDCNNYRGIYISSCLGKFFCVILNERLHNYTREQNIIHPSQIGFLPGYRTADHILTLKSLIDKYVNQKTNGKIYICMLCRFQKRHLTLFGTMAYLLKLLRSGVGGNVYSLIKNLYSKSRCAVKQSEHRTSFFPYRQGCIISPLLFNIYLNDIPSLLDNKDSDPLTLQNGTKLNCLLYADDLIILSRSKVGLQSCLNQLNNWCNKWMMEVNLKKTKVMIFQKPMSKQQTPKFLFANKILQVTQDYNYLGLKLTTNGEFTIAMKQLADKAKHAMHVQHKEKKLIFTH